MPVKSFYALYVNEDWSTGHSSSFTEVIKARTVEEAQEQASKISVEMGPDTMLLSVSRRVKVNMARLTDKYRRWERRADHPAPYRHRYGKRRRKAA